MTHKQRHGGKAHRSTATSPQHNSCAVVELKTLAIRTYPISRHAARLPARPKQIALLRHGPYSRMTSVLLFIFLMTGIPATSFDRPQTPPILPTPFTFPSAFYQVLACWCVIDLTNQNLCVVCLKGVGLSTRHEPARAADLPNLVLHLLGHSVLPEISIISLHCAPVVYAKRNGHSIYAGASHPGCG